MFHVEADDFQALDTFELRWRWTEPDQAVLPETVLRQIHPLQLSKAQQIENDLLSTGQKLFLYTSQPIPEQRVQLLPFEWIRRLKIGKQSRDMVAGWLAAQGTPTDVTMLLSWEKTVAAMVPWHIFCQYWDDFCYAGSDDVCIASLCGTWFLLYYHQDIFLMGKVS